MKFYYVLSACCLFLLSCDCHYEGYGYVYDRATNNPMPNVRIDVSSAKPWKDTISTPIYTDANGYFAYSHDFCYDMMQAHHPNYIGHIFSQIKGDTIYLEFLEGNGVED